MLMKCIQCSGSMYGHSKSQLNARCNGNHIWLDILQLWKWWKSFCQWIIFCLYRILFCRRQWKHWKLEALEISSIWMVDLYLRQIDRKPGHLIISLAGLGLLTFFKKNNASTIPACSLLCAILKKLFKMKNRIMRALPLARIKWPLLTALFSFLSSSPFFTFIPR